MHAGTTDISERHLKEKIQTIRGVQVMLDHELAGLYGVSTRVLNQAVKRNNERFPESFMFQLTDEETRILKSQSVTSSWGGRRHLPNAFTEQGVAMLSAGLKSGTAITVSVKIIEAFVDMRRFINDNAGIFQRLDKLELNQLEHNKNFERIFNAIEDKSLTKEQGIFYDGQVFDAHRFVSELIRSARESIILIDNYVDDRTLTLFAKREQHIPVTIYTKNATKQIKLDLEKHNRQYPPLAIKEFRDAHDRSLIIDRNHMYHIGASLKDAGKKWFAFSKLHQDAPLMLEKLRHQG